LGRVELFVVRLSQILELAVGKEVADLSESAERPP